jgi:anaerobic magnesium-protoporphyrin IX monomethyl ester cyclase
LDLLLAHGYFLADDPQERSVQKPYPPLGLLYLKSHLTARGFSVSVFDSTFRSFDEFRALLQRERPPVVGLYVNLMTKTTVLRMAAECRRQGALVVMGGPEPAPSAERYLEHGADVVVVGEGEITLEELLPALVKAPGRRDWSKIAGLVYRDETGALVRTSPRALIRDLDAQPWPDRDAIDIGLYLDAWRNRHGRGSVSLITARGCPYTCRWCSRSVFGETHRRRSVASVADEVEGIVERYNPEMVWFADDVFTIHRGWTLAFATEMRRRGLRIPFECISRAERIDEDVAEALQSLGCFRLWIGSESGSQRILDAMDRRVKVEEVQRATRLLQANGIEVGMFLMLGYPGEQQADIVATVDHLKRARPDVFLTTVAYPITGTPFHAEVADRVITPGPWEATTDRDTLLAGREGRKYFQFARRFIDAEVARDRHWRAGRWWKAARAAASAGVGRVGMAALGASSQETQDDATRGSATRLGAEIGVRVLRMASAFLLVAGLGATGFGMYAALWGLAVLVAEAADLGLRTAACPGVAARRIGLAPLVRTKLWLLGVSFCLLGVAAVPLLSSAGGAGTALPLLAFMAAALLVTGAELGGVLLRAVGRRMEEAAVLMTMGACTLGGVAWLLADPALGTRLLDLAAVQAGAAVVAMLLAAWWLTRAAVPDALERVGSRAILAESLPLGLNGALALATMRIEILILFLWHGPLETGLFAAALKLVEALNAVPGALAAGALPTMAREGRSALGAARVRTAATLLVLAIPTAFLLLLVAPLCAVRLGYAGAGMPLRILAAAVVPMFVNSGALHALLAVGRGELLPRLTATRLVCATLLGLMLIPRFGAAGAAAGLAVSEWILLAMALRACRQAEVGIPLGRRLFSRVLAEGARVG